MKKPAKTARTVAAKATARNRHPVADKIRERSKQLGLTVPQFLEKAKLGQSFLKDLEQGRTKSVTTRALQKLADAGQTSVSYFQGEVMDGAEGEVIQIYRRAEPQQKEAIVDFLRRMVPKK